MLLSPNRASSRTCYAVWFFPCFRCPLTEDVKYSTTALNCSQELNGIIDDSDCFIEKKKPCDPGLAIYPVSVIIILNFYIIISLHVSIYLTVFLSSFLLIFQIFICLSIFLCDSLFVYPSILPLFLCIL